MNVRFSILSIDIQSSPTEPEESRGTIITTTPTGTKAEAFKPTPTTKAIKAELAKHSPTLVAKSIAWFISWLNHS
jgi:hypothetical protein